MIHANILGATGDSAALKCTDTTRPFSLITRRGRAAEEASANSKSVVTRIIDLKNPLWGLSVDRSCVNVTIITTHTTCGACA